MPVVCPTCHAQNPTSRTSCTNCGAPLESAQSGSPVGRPARRFGPTTSDHVYYSDDRVEVTSARAVLGRRTYIIADILDVSMETQSPNRLLGVLVIAAGIVAIISPLAMGADSLLCIGIGALATLGGLLLVIFQRRQYIVWVETDSREVRALKSSDRAMTLEVVNAIRQAMHELG